jgi:isocitrate/isopropylmalate dehydrogenase
LRHPPSQPSVIHATAPARSLCTRPTAQHETIEAAIERGQKLDTLIEKSNELSGSSKLFYKTAKKQNQCCHLM